MKSDGIKKLEDLAFQHKKMKLPNTPDHAIARKKYSQKNSNELTKSIIAYIQLMGGAAWRINVQGQYDAKLGRFRKSGMRKGVPDIIGCIKGKFLGIEVKYGKDRQSEDQKKIEAEVKKADGIYIIAKQLEDVIQLIESLHDNYI